MFAMQPNVDINALETAIDSSGLTQWDYMSAAIIVVAAIVFGRVVRMVLSKAISRAGADHFIGQLLGRLVGYVVVVIGLVYALDTLGIAALPAIGALGIAGIALAFALQDLLENFVAGLLLQMRRPFKSGQEVVIAGEEGVVVEVDARAVTLDTPDGERVRVPSSAVIKNAIVNHSARGLRRTDLAVGVAYGTDLNRAKEVLVEAVTAAPGITTLPAVEALVSEFAESSIVFTVRFWHEPSIRGHWQARDAAAIAISQGLRAAGIEIPFPQRVLTIAADRNAPQPSSADHSAS